MDGYSERLHQQSLRKRLASRNNGFVPFDLVGDETIPGLFGLQVSVHADKPAIVSGGSVLTYRELDALSWDIGRTIGSALRTTRSEPVALLISQHCHFAASALGVLKAGGFYIPLDPAFPEARNALILQESGSKLVLTERAHRDLAERLVSLDQTLLYVDDVPSRGDKFLEEDNADNLAYIIFTSGSTGRPKGAIQTQRNVLQVVKRYTNSLCLGKSDRVSLLSSCSVTASAAPLLSSLLNGATLSAFSVRDGGLNALADWLDSERITLYHSVPSLFRHLMKNVNPERQFLNLRVVRLGGDGAYKTDWELYTRHCPADAVLVNSYGCSEISSVACFYMDTGSRLTDNILPVGYPMPDVRISLLNADESETSVGEVHGASSRASVGEIVLRSPYLSPGYWSEFAANEFPMSVTNAGVEREYKTGDLGVIRPEQGLVHVGREDSQVKLAGFRVEIAEVEACLLAYPGVREAAVLGHTPEHGERELLGFVEMDSGDVHCGSFVRSFVNSRLPGHMVPSEIVAVARMPCTPNGKVDRAALLRMRAAVRNAKGRRAPSTPTECSLCEIWMESLHLEQVGVDDNFFELGGNSLLGMKLTAQVATRFSVRPPALMIFNYSTIQQMAQLVERLLSDAVPASSQLDFEEGII